MEVLEDKLWMWMWEVGEAFVGRGCLEGVFARGFENCEELCSRLQGE